MVRKNLRIVPFCERGMKNNDWEQRYTMKKALVCGAGGFIGSHLVKRLKKEGYWVKGVDLKYPEFSSTAADDFVLGDLRDPMLCRDMLDRPYDELYQLAADMGGWIRFYRRKRRRHYAQFRIDQLEHARDML